VTIASGNNNPLLAKENDVITLSIAANEAIVSPSVTMADGTGNIAAGDVVVAAAVISGVTDTTGKYWTAKTTVAAGAASNAVVTFSISFNDPAINYGTTRSAVDSPGGGSVTIDNTAVTVTLDTAIITPNNLQEPSIKFTTNKDGTVTTDSPLEISSSASVSATGIQTVTFNTLPEGTYTNKKIYVTDATGNVGSLTIDDFVIDITPPVVALVNGVGIATPAQEQKPSIAFTTSKDGTVTTSLSQGIYSPASVSASGTQTVQFNTLAADETYTGETITVMDAAGNSGTLTIPDFVIDNEDPTLLTVTIVSSNISNSSLASDGQTVTISIIASEDIAEPVVTMFTAGGTGLSVTYSGTDAEWTASATVPAEAAAEGVVTFEITPTDLAGNVGSVVSATTDSGTVTIDNTHPQVTGLTGSWYPDTPTFSFPTTLPVGRRPIVEAQSVEVSTSGAVGQTATLSIDWSVVGQGVVGSNGKTTMVLEPAYLNVLGTGQHYMAVNLSDAAGNTAEQFGTTFVFASGDPYVQPMIGAGFWLPMAADCFRMLQGEDLVVNALTRPTTETEKSDMISFAESLTGSCPTGAEVEGVFFGKLFIASEDRTLTLDYDARRGTVSEEGYFTITSDAREGKCTPYGDKHQAVLHGVRAVLISFTHSLYGRMEIHASFSSNPWVKHGLAARLPSNAAQQGLTGLLIREYHCKSMRVNKLTSRRKKTGTAKRNRVKVRFAGEVI